MPVHHNRQSGSVGLSRCGMHRRLKAAIEAAPFVHPQLKATAVIVGERLLLRGWNEELSAVIKADRGEAYSFWLVRSSRSNSKAPSRRANGSASSHDLITVVTKDIHPC